MKNNKLHIFVPLLLPLAFTAGMVLFYPFRFRFEFNADEGINLIKAMLTLRGFNLYSDFWSDQPPVFNAILTFWFSLIGMKVSAGRILILGFSTLLLISAMYYLQRFWGIAYAILGMIAIVTLPFYFSLSVSVMIGLPSIAFALLSFVGIARWHQNKSDFWLIFSAVFLALSVMTKIWTVILAPIFLAGIFIDKAGLFRGNPNLRDSVRPIMTWSLGFFLVASLFILFVIRPVNVPQLISVHLAASATEEMQSIAAVLPMSSYLNDSNIIFLLALLGAVIAIRSRAWHALYLVAWVLAAYVLLSWNVPFWYHHQLLITIPAALLASIAMGAAVVVVFERIRISKLWTLRAVPFAAILLLTVFFAFQRIPLTLSGLRFDLPNVYGTYDPTDHVDYEIVALIRKYADKTTSLFTDRPMYAFRSGMPVHPYLAVITAKRYYTGQPSQEEILSILLETKPEQVIINRFDFPAVKEYMEPRNFRRVDNSPQSRHYVIGEIFANP
jgi:hypothetical protein